MNEPVTSKVSDLAAPLWSAWITGRSTRAVREMSLDEGLAVLQSLTAKRVESGDPIVGWKIARLPGPEHVAFAGPVFASSLQPNCLIRAMQAQVEVEFVARVERAGRREPFDANSLSWHVGLEFIDNHDPDWVLAPGWAAADWGLHLGAVVGEPCGPPTFESPVVVELEIPPLRLTEAGAWRVGPDQMIELLRRDCPRLARPCQVGDFVWTGALVAPQPLTTGASITATVEGFGTVTFERT